MRSVKMNHMNVPDLILFHSIQFNLIQIQFISIAKRGKSGGECRLYRGHKLYKNLYHHLL